MSLFRRREPEFDWEDTRPFTGTSLTGLPDNDADPAATYRAAIAQANAEAAHDTAPLDRIRARGPHPATFPALKDDPRDTGPMQRMPRIRKVQERERPIRPADAFIPVWSELLQQHIMLCGVCPPERRNRYADPTTAHMPFTFEALRASAYQAGWRLDAFARWACPACQATDRYHAPYGVTHYDAHAAQARIDGDPHAERDHRAAAEHDLIRDVTLAARHGRHRVRAS